ncbi:MAG: deferrochelatase/peroxidase EfeB [Tessaracoccus sp.]|uniref:iron uptake transporter deferrochelatase/peroxidase subunit n=1 Tax=Tessaracoccus sp. TaxID=1971211 RepID=UPI001ED0DE0C|nr:iron uptake transporter deferrochelatase/peroxidase subunit [Tessaracoccus sp.]MBK7819665.1 deferrochelatase/peroxidase EfeB [Tessaracoccus sp.]
MSDVSRRGLFGAAAVGGAAAGALVLANVASRSGEPASTSGAERAYPYFGEHQAGIVTPAQDRMHFAAFDVAYGVDRDGLISLLRDWTDAAARMTQGSSAGELDPMSGPYDAPPQDTGEAYGLPPSGLTITFGFGPTLFVDGRGKDRFGIGERCPEALQRLPHFVADNLNPAVSDGDLCVQACADDPQVAVHAVRNLTRIAFGRAVLRWSQLGFGRTSSTSITQETPRNLFGFKDGTMGLRGEQTDLIDEHVWVPSGADPAAEWLAGGSYLVARKIKMQIETWDRSAMREQETIVGRTKREGAPLSGGQEFDQPDFALLGREGTPIMDVDSHVALAHPDHNDGVHMLRRGYNYVDGNDQLGRLSAGLFFIAFVTDPRTHYIPMQSRMSRNDLMMEYLQHIGSGLWAVPPGIREGDFVGKALFTG